MAVKGKIQNISSAESFFKGVGDIVLFDALNLATGSLNDLTGAKSLGSILLSSTKWSGDAPKETQIKDEKGNVVITTSEAGTFGFEFTVLSTATEIMQKLMKAGVISETFAVGDTFGVGSTVLGFGVDLPVVECPIAVINETLNQTMIYPNGKITSSLTNDNGVTCIKCTVTAQKVSSNVLKTVMLVNGAANYTTDPA